MRFFHKYLIYNLRLLFKLFVNVYPHDTTYSYVINEWKPLLIILFGTPNISAHISETVDNQEKRFPQKFLQIQPCLHLCSFETSMTNIGEISSQNFSI